MRHLASRCLLTATSSILLFTLSFNAQAAPPSSAPPPLSLLQGESPLYEIHRSPSAQMDDPDLVRELAEEETLVDLQNIEYSNDALSSGRGVLLSLVPGAGWSLIYANRRAQGVLIILGATVGYGMGVAYLAGVFDENAERRCVLTDSSRNSIFVGLKYCSPDSPIDPMNANATRPSYDPYLYKNDATNDPELRVILKGDQPQPPTSYRIPLYSEVSELYKEQKRGSDYNGAKTGQIILASTYAVTTLISAIWTSLEIKDQNKELRKQIESTAQGPRPVDRSSTTVSAIRPSFQYNGQQTMMGLGAQF